VFGLPNQSNINVGLALPLFNERAHFTLGGTFDVPLQQSNDIQTSLRLFPDVSLELLLNKSGSIKATFFYKQNVDFLTGNPAAGTGLAPRRYGASISYGKEFDNLGELFGKKAPRRTRPQSDTTQQQDLDSIGTK
jgi:hypothetical protein